MEKHAAPGGGYRGNGTEPTVKTGPTLKSELKAPSQLKILQRVYKVSLGPTRLCREAQKTKDAEMIF